jgi:HEAT repeat protein
VRRLVAFLHKHDWLVDRSGVLIDLEVRRRIEAVDALGAVGGEEAENGLLTALGDVDPRVRTAAVAALGPRPGHRAAKALAAAVPTWRDPELSGARDAALDLLVELADEVHAVVYAQTLVDERRESLSPAEEDALRRLFAADSGPVAELFAEELTEALGATDGAERPLEAQTLVAMGEISVKPLVSALRYPARRTSAIAALGAIRDVRPVPALVDLLSEADPKVRLHAARALGEIRDPRALEPLVRASGDQNADVRDAALEALDRMRSILGLLGAAALMADNAAPERPGSEPEAARVLPPVTSDQASLLRRLRSRGR